MTPGGALLDRTGVGWAIQSSNSMRPLTFTETWLSPPSSGAEAASAAIAAARMRGEKAEPSKESIHGS